ncbi:DNA-binding transcriptional LysR family regulator [Clostridium moniliforme]|uniref:DNA-binding transcriptional LysR family regulator n=1 Tax=Clostridium moniliforme TaxID=39489 RepID=A0ABS4EY27_9CLOT|nr:LysR substrate-binding domain-containing protein [Clostridium moniliforme]MBP1888908.1 DNA-binding transcriptional LysR family regulator [Clostridium moniliforme]
MNFRKLRIFYETAINLNMTKVAKSLYISQPSVSQAIQELEEELGVKVFDRIGKRLTLTYEGKVYFNYVRRILNLYDEGVDTIRQINNKEQGKIVIGASTTIGTYILPAIIKNFVEKNKGIDISLIIENTENIEKMILQNKVDFAFVEGNIHSEEVVYEKIWEDELVFIAPYNHKWSNKKYLNKDDIKNEKFIMREKGSGSREIVEIYLKEHGIKYKTFMELGSTEAIKKSVEAGLGIGCISKECALEEVERKELIKITFNKERIYRDLLLVAHKDKFISNNMREFIEEAKQKI